MESGINLTRLGESHTLRKEEKALSLPTTIRSMPRVPYVQPVRGESAIADMIRSRRKDGELTELDGVL